jgi:hypothetical protein
MLCFVIFHFALDVGYASWSLPSNDDFLIFSNISKMVDTLITFSDDRLKNSCKFSETSIIATYSTNYLVPLLRYQYESTKLYGGVDSYCISKRFITICVDHGCYHSCMNEGFLNCVLVDMMIAEFPASDFRKGAYNYLTHVKTLLIKSLLDSTDDLFFIDADVLLYRNPWKRDYFKNLTTAKGSIGDNCEFMYQLESFTDPLSVNGGQYYIRNTPAIHRYLDQMLSHREQICRGDALEQEYAVLALKSSHVRMCGLPPRVFYSHCFHETETARPNIRRLVSFHVNCEVGYEKLVLMKEHLSFMKRFYLNISNGNILMD